MLRALSRFHLSLSTNTGTIVLEYYSPLTPCHVFVCCQICYPPAHPERRWAAMRWAQFMLVGHAVVWIVALVNG